MIEITSLLPSALTTPDNLITLLILSMIIPVIPAILWACVSSTGPAEQLQPFLLNAGKAIAQPSFWSTPLVLTAIAWGLCFTLVVTYVLRQAKPTPPAK